MTPGRLTLTAQPRRARTLLLGVVAPAALVGAATLVVRSWLPRIPDPAVLHWGADGPDRVGPFSELMTGVLALAGVTWLMFSTFVLVASHNEIARRVLVGGAVTQGAIYAGVLLGSAWVQLDAGTAAAVDGPGAELTVLLLAALILGGVAAGLAGADPHLPAAEPVPEDAARVTPSSAADSVWLDHPAVRHEALWWVGAALWLGLAVMVAYVSSQWWLLAVFLLPAVAVLGTLNWTVQIDHTGLRARALLGWPRLTVRVEEVHRADVITVHPLAEFGGWGLRSRLDGTSGLVVRRGDAIQVRTSGDRTIVVTSDDATRGAALLNTMADRSRDTPTQ